jgi:dihydroorotase
MNYLITNARIINEGKIFLGSVWIKDGIIKGIVDTDVSPGEFGNLNCQHIDAQGKYLLPGIIDDQVHFRDPGLSAKADIYTESKAAVAGGITSFMEMPNTIPNTLTQELLEEKYKLGAEKSLANYSFYMGASNDNLDEIVKTDPKTVCGIKVFMGASTGNMLVDDPETLKGIFRDAPTLVAVHCEDEDTIKANTKLYREKYGEDIPIELHPEIRSAEACYKSSSFAVGLAKKFGTRLHVLHLTTAREMELFRNDIPLKDKKITSEVCVHHLWFSEEDYKQKGTFIKWNPAVKKASDRAGLWKALLDDRLDVIATDHAPHTLEEKQNSYFKAPSGGPLVQHSLVAMLEAHRQGKISLEKIVEKMCHAPADCFSVDRRGYIRPGYYADLVLVDLDNKWTVEKNNVLYKCGWSPFEGTEFNSRVTHTFVNGHLVYDNGNFDESQKGQRLTFNR